MTVNYRVGPAGFLTLGIEEVYTDKYIFIITMMTIIFYNIDPLITTSICITISPPLLQVIIGAWQCRPVGPAGCTEMGFKDIILKTSFLFFKKPENYMKCNFGSVSQVQENIAAFGGDPGRV